MKKKWIFVTGIVLLLCLLCTCSFWGAGTENEDAAAAEEKPIEKPPIGTGTEKPEEGEGEEEPEEGEEPDEEKEPEIPQAAEFLGCEAVSEREIVFEFSQSVTVVEIQFDPEMEYQVAEDEGGVVRVILREDTKPGQQITAALQVEDEFGNTVKEKVTFRSRNNRVPALQINELRTEYASSTSTSGAKAEYIEFKILSSGNLGALRVFVTGNNKNPLLYIFEPVDVEEEEYIVLHLRKLEELCKDEYGDSLAESGGADSSSTARDFWIPGSNKLLHKTDIIYVLDQDGNVLDAVMITDKPGVPWSSDFAKTAEFLFNQGIWISPMGTICTPADVVNAANTTATRTICRDETVENTHTVADWYITVTSGVTPGLPNNPKRL
jgi:hypothetical protein